MTASETKSALNELPERLKRCMNKLERLLVPPFEAMPGNEFNESVDAIRNETGADAVSIFLVSEDEPNWLIFAAGVGYKEEYHRSRYFLNGPFLTSYVCRESKPINSRLEDLEQGKDGIPFSRRCAIYIQKQRFINIVAVPILFQNKCLGVLKLENKGESPSEKFPEEDFALAQVLASYIAIAYQQRVYSKLWSEGELIKKQSRSLEAYAQSATRILAKFLNAECVSIFIKSRSDSGEPVLKYAGGVGYRDAYRDHIYALDGNTLTASIARSQWPMMMTEAEILERKMPYTGACIGFINSGSFRNIIAMPLMDESGELFGILKVENKLPEQFLFDMHDFELCKAFVSQQILPTLSRIMSNISGHRPSTPGFLLLVEKLGTSERRKSNDLSELVKKVNLLKKNEHIITGDDCSAYLQISKPHFYRLTRPKK